MAVEIGSGNENSRIGDIGGIEAVLNTVELDKTIPKFRMKEFSRIGAVAGGEKFVIDQVVLWRNGTGFQVENATDGVRMTVGHAVGVPVKGLKIHD